MKELDGFIKHIFKYEKKVYSEENFKDRGIWICQFIGHDIELANKYVLYRLEEANSRSEKLEFLYACKACIIGFLEDPLFLHGNNDGDSDKSVAETIDKYRTVKKRVEIAIKYYLDCKNIDCDEESKFLNRYTTSQLVLIFYYGLKYLGIELRVNCDIAPAAKFIHLIVGKKVSLPSNSDIYKMLRKAPLVKSDKLLVKDLIIVKKAFQQVGLKEVVQSIDNEIDTAKKERKRRA